MSVQWKRTGQNSYDAHDRQDTSIVLRKAPRIYLVFGSHSQLRSYVEFYAQNNNRKRFIDDFIAAWVKVMNAGHIIEHEIQKIDLQKYNNAVSLKMAYPQKFYQGCKVSRGKRNFFVLTFCALIPQAQA